MDENESDGIDGGDSTATGGRGDSASDSGGSGSSGSDSGGGSGEFRLLGRDIGNRTRGIGIEIGGRIKTKGQPKTPNEIGMGPFLRAANAPEKKPRIPMAPSKAQPRGKSTPEDEEDLKSVVGGLYGGLALMTGFNGWAMPEDECELIAKPLSRIMARNPTAQSYVREIADPFALVVAIGLPTVMRYQMWRDYIKLKKELALRGLTMEDVQRSQAPPPSPDVNKPTRSASPLWKSATAETTRLSSIV